jgi:transcriptional regulator with XRE-family HTH domain
MSINEKIRLIRETKGFTQEQVAEKLGISSSVYGDIERGENDPKLSKLQKIAEAFDVQLSELVDLSDKGNLNVTFASCNQKKFYIGSSSAELEKSVLLLKERDKEVENLKMQISQLQEIMGLLRKDTK